MKVETPIKKKGTRKPKPKILLSQWAEENHFSYAAALYGYQQELLPVEVTEDKRGQLWVEPEKIIRAVKLSLQFTTASKQHKIQHILGPYRAVVNRFIKLLWKTPGKLDKNTLERITNTRLTERYKSQALKHALEIVTNTKKSAQALKVVASCPVFKGPAKLDAKFLHLTAGTNTFDLWARLSTLKRQNLIELPLKTTAVFHRWMNRAGSKLIQGGLVDEKSLIVFIQLASEPYKDTGLTEALDLGMNKLAVDSQGTIYGPKFKAILQKIKRCQAGSEGKRRARAHRDNYINQTLNQLPWQHWRFLGLENLNGIKKGKKKTSKQFRIARAPWVQAQVRMRIKHKSQENRVFLINYNPAGTSITCPVVKCGKVHKSNRQGEIFQCVSCGYRDDADHVGALNGLVRTRRLLGSLESPSSKKSKY